MRPDDRGSALDELLDPGLDLPFDADLESLDGELAAAGRTARRMLAGRTQPTRLFSNQLRAHLLGLTAVAATPSSVAGALRDQADDRVAAHRQPTAAGDDRGKDRGDARAQRQAVTLAPRTILALLAIASMGALLAVGALGGTFGPALP